MMKLYVPACLFFCCLCLFAGCSQSVNLKGTVTFEDGSPLTCGIVVFDDGKNLARGPIQTDGSFVMGFKEKGSGLPPGNYKVCITGAMEIKKTEQDSKPGFGEKNTNPGSSFSSVSPSLVHAKYATTATTDLSCEVTSSTREVNFTVERPRK